MHHELARLVCVPLTAGGKLLIDGTTFDGEAVYIYIYIYDDDDDDDDGESVVTRKVIFFDLFSVLKNACFCLCFDDF